MLQGVKRFNEIIVCLPPAIGQLLENLPQEDKARVTEIRLRLGGPVVIYIGADGYYINTVGALTKNANGTLILGKEDIEAVFERFCSFSVYAHQDEINSGYISVKGGHRVGVCGQAVYSGGVITSVRNISSLNIRLSRQVKGIADNYAEYLKLGAIIAGPPASGKTTMLRDAVRCLSKGGVRVAVIDSRGEIAASSGGAPQYDMGFNCDVLTGYTKTHGIDVAVRTLNPQVVAFDEVSAINESEQIINGFFCGVSFICTAHAGSVAELYERDITEKILSSGAVKYILFLNSIHSSPRLITVNASTTLKEVQYV